MLLHFFLMTAAPLAPEYSNVFEVTEKSLQHLGENIRRKQRRKSTVDANQSAADDMSCCLLTAVVALD